jgi:hypothetical protein
MERTHRTTEATIGTTVKPRPENPPEKIAILYRHRIYCEYFWCRLFGFIFLNGR